jgi:mRNA interferase RelE/StbE
MAYELRYTADAERGIADMPVRERRTLLTKLERLALDPYGMPGVQRLQGRDGYRLRVGDYRAVYLLEDGQLLVIVIRVAHRREVYR